MEIYLDESGDLGWMLSEPYQRGGSSRFLVITALIVPAASSHHPKRLMRQFYKSRGWDSKQEKKWADMSLQARSAFVVQAKTLLTKYPDITCRSIVADKSKLPTNTRLAPELVYNYMTKLLLLDTIKSFQAVSLFPDQRSLKMGSEGSLHDYLQTELWFACGANTRLTTTPIDSRHSLNLQFADMLSGVVFSAYEMGRADFLTPISSLIAVEQLHGNRNPS